MKRRALAADTALSRIRGDIADLETENIALLAERAGSIEDVITLWYGESDVVTPAFIRQAAKDSLDQGETFYVPEMAARPDLARELSRYQSELHGVNIGLDRSTVAPGGMQAVIIALELIVDKGSNVVYLEPQWPNIRHAIQIAGGEARPVPLDYVEGDWRLDLDRLFDACDARTKAIMFSTPSNPCGWTASPEEQQALLEFSRETGVWIISDEVYNRLYFHGPSAPSMMRLAGEEDLVMCINGFSKAWAMTGWRLGWLNHPASVAPAVRAMTQYMNSGTPPFVQAGALTALRDGEDFVRSVRDRCAQGLSVVYERLGRSNRIRLSNKPKGGMYAFFSVDEADSASAVCARLLEEAHVGLAPGHLFGETSKDFIRMCVCNDPELLEEACRRIEAVM
ncbi:aminotransferase class I/II-fold pyridoxal phosphate-dependent enzyme [Pararhizobium mangrovi]|uniref:Aminotransferase n=1 Tax=Pararhizobium mangrovi TaxID=2590452 RepID=A0A506UAX1_9HYPH|nr:aminotransferase class I/II-fold pyridoxal phosphate-dependent enzyme [Pararhizobium mangrovi]TPW30204.1 aminotransferase class I/II-fold pyridoxal phosphate-dependent enzyme [Pararhizobium mangrovi]